MTIEKITATKGDTFTLNVTIQYDSGALDLTNATAYFTIKEKYTDLDSEAVVQKIVTTHTDPTAGETQFSLAPTDTANLEAKSYIYDVQITTSGGAKYTPISGDFVLLDHVTKS